MKILYLCTDSYGGHGGIAQYNRDTLDALAANVDVTEITLLQRLMPASPGRIPDKVKLSKLALGGKIAFTVSTAIEMAREKDVIICAHINLLQIAFFASVLRNSRLILLVYGIEVWESLGLVTKFFLRKVSQIWTISDFTKQKMISWSKADGKKFRIMPNGIDFEKYYSGPRPQYLVDRYKVDSRSKVIMTLARLPSYDRYKGVDEVLEAMPAVLEQSNENIIYIVVGDGEDRKRLQDKVKALSLEANVFFAGRILESEKADYLNLADLFILPGRCEGFGFVFLEAMACGVPVVGSTLDGSREALMNGEIGTLVNPLEIDAVARAIRDGVYKKKGVPSQIVYFGISSFRARIAESLKQI